MGRVAGLGHWETHEQLIDLLHAEFERTELTDWVKVAEHGQHWLSRLHDCEALLMAVAGQAAHGALWALADRLGVLRKPFAELCDDVAEITRAEFVAKLMDLVAHGQGQCGDDECDLCGERSEVLQ